MRMRADARKKSSQKSTRPRGAKDAVTFPGAIGRNNACVRADLQQVALGGRKRLPRVGECIVADGRLPCQRQPLRGQRLPSQGVDPSTWFVDLRGDGLNPFKRVNRRVAVIQILCSKPHDDLPLGEHSCFVVGGEDTAGRHNGSRRVYLRFREKLLRCAQF